jgi:hypothetical protein
MADGGGGDTTSTTVQELSPEQKKILGFATPIFQQYLQGGISQLQDMVYPGATVAPQSANEQLANSMLKQQALGPMQQSANTMLGGLNFLTSGKALNPNTNPALKGAIDAAVRPLTQEFSRTIMPQIRGDLILDGGYGSNRQGIETANASEMLARSIGDVSSNIAFQGYNAGLDAQSRALAFAPGAMQAAQLPGMTIAGIGAQERAFDQALINDEMQQWYNQGFFPLMIAQQIAGTAFGYPGGQTIANTQGAGGGAMGGLSGALGGAALGSAIAPGWGTAIGGGLGALMGLFG